MDYEKAYKEALKRAESLIDFCSDSELKTLENVFPELRKSEDERIRQFLIHEITETSDKVMSYRNMNKKDVLAWLEKQGSQDNNEDVNILYRFSFYSYKDEPNIIYLSGLYVDSKYRNKGIGTKILEVADEVARSLNCYAIRLKTKKDSEAERLYRTHGYNSLATEDKDEIWLEKQKESNINTHLPSFDEAQGTPIVEQCEKKSIKEHDVCDFCEGRYGCINPCPVKLIEQKPVDKVEPKFKVGDWVVNDTSKDVFLIKSINNGYCTLEDIKGNTISPCLSPCESKSHLWTIQDAKDGDVLATINKNIFIFKSINNYTIYDYCGLYFGDFMEYSKAVNNPTAVQLPVGYHPATKEQRDFLFAKMKEAGYEWDSEKKELKKIEEPENYKKQVMSEMTDLVKDYITQKPTTWNEEDELLIRELESLVKQAWTTAEHENDKDKIHKMSNLSFFLKTLKPQLKQEWSEKDEERIEQICEDLKCGLENFCSGKNVKGLHFEEIIKSNIDWLKSIKERYTWKPSDAQMASITCAVRNMKESACYDSELVSLLNDLKKLKG